QRRLHARPRALSAPRLSPASNLRLTSGKAPHPTLWLRHSPALAPGVPPRRVIAEETVLRIGPIKRRTLAVSAALMLVGGSLGAVGARELPVLAATPTPTPTAASASPRQQRQEQFLATLAGKLNVSVDQLKQAISDTRAELGMPAHPLGPGGLRGRGHRPGGGPGALAPRPGGPFGAALGAAAN